MTVGPGTYAHRYVPKRNVLKNGPQTNSSNGGSSSNSTSSSSSSSSSGHPYKRSQPGPSTASDPPGNVGPSGFYLIQQIVPLPLVPARRPHVVVQGAQNPGALGPPNPRAEKRRFIQQHLVLILHAFQCRRKQLHEFCQLPHCATFREVLGHMSTCQHEIACHFPHCTSSKQIYRHWKTCHRADCSICVPIRLADRLERNHY
ncbi:histone acetyltransferase p300-like [Thrips palmi]|uniref:histone acetyltransferase n=1 Tax=Thrips palmi TaxID=161013 RepID=A0A6P8Z5J5_THRPL|nr:histone acetyltransferase p300-like [Thrips palmi]XP_034245107.1 histone acetyltransferase p300-like [Thrips palmi]